MRADDAIDVVARVTGLFEVAQERQLQIAPCRVGTNLLIADAGVDDDALALRLDHQRVDAHAELALLVRESWIEPVGFLLDVVAGGVRQEPGAGPWRLALDNPGYLDVADFELVHHDPPASRQLSPNFEDSPSVNVRYEVRYSYSRTNAPNGGNRDGKNSRRRPAEGYRRDRAAAQSMGEGKSHGEHPDDARRVRRWRQVLRMEPQRLCLRRDRRVGDAVGVAGQVESERDAGRG